MTCAVAYLHRSRAEPLGASDRAMSRASTARDFKPSRMALALSPPVEKRSATSLDISLTSFIFGGTKHGVRVKLSRPGAARLRPFLVGVGKDVDGAFEFLQLRPLLVVDSGAADCRGAEAERGQ